MSTGSPRRGRGRPPTHGGRLLARVLRNNQLDGRTDAARQYYGVQDALAADRGGWEHTTATERILIEVAAAELLILRAILAWSLRQPSMVIDTPTGSQLLGPLMKGFTSHAGALTRALSALGIRPDKVQRLPDLSEYISHRRTNLHGATRAPESDTTAIADPEGMSATSGAASAAARGGEPRS